LVIQSVIRPNRRDHGWVLPRFAPMLASAGPLGRGSWAFEPKLDGWRALVYVGDGVQVLSRRGSDLTRSLPELAGMSAVGPCVLDGELVGGDGRPESFYGLLGRIAASPTNIGGRPPVTFMAFDVLWLDGDDVTRSAWSERRALLEGLDVSGPRWATVPAYRLTAEDVGRACIELGLEGMVAKRCHSRYRPGVRSSDWLKLKTSAWRRDHLPNRHGVASRDRG
jgi:bifunctional non-homologous end joining protein LigD